MGVPTRNLQLVLRTNFRERYHRGLLHLCSVLQRLLTVYLPGKVHTLFTSFCEAVMLAKEVAERDRERLAIDARLRCRRRRRPVRQTSNDDLRPP